MLDTMLDALLTEKSRELAGSFKPGFLQRELTVFQFNFETDASFYLTVTADTFEFVSGTIANPTITLFITNHEQCWGLLEGSIDGMTAFMEGNYRADGNIVLSQLVLYLFKRDDPTLIYEVQD